MLFKQWNVIPLALVFHRSNGSKLARRRKCFSVLTHSSDNKVADHIDGEHVIARHVRAYTHGTTELHYISLLLSFLLLHLCTPISAAASKYFCCCIYDYVRPLLLLHLLCTPTSVAASMYSCCIYVLLLLHLGTPTSVAASIYFGCCIYVLLLLLLHLCTPNSAAASMYSYYCCCIYVLLLLQPLLSLL